MEEESLRRCFVDPIPELDIAAELLSQAADALMAGDLASARALLAKADIEAVRAHATNIMGGRDKAIYRYRPVVDAPARLARAERSRDRAPSKTVAASVLARDGYRCRFCGCRVVSARARDVMDRLLPGVGLWPRQDRDRHAAFLALSAVVDHLVPHARGGGSQEENLVTACQSCNYGRMDWIIEEVSLSDPRLRAPIVDEWDGLTRLLAAHVANSNVAKAPQLRVDNTREKPRRASPTVVAAGHPWFSESPYFADAITSGLLDLMEGMAPVGVSLHVREVLLVRLTAGAEKIDVFGIERTGEIEVPWMIGPHKRAFRPFAEKLAAMIPGGEVYETPKIWRVKRHGCRLTVADILGVSDDLKAAMGELAMRLSMPPSP
jgi:5-methylcytosine-specific restriction endonuclease McrA